tara:strand:+ start:111 stop:410 length:300 start_codon:yes stop_codon:yes gene_type:complete
MMKKTMLSLFIGLFLFSCSDLKTLSEDVKKVKQDQSLIIQKLNSLEKKMADVAKASPSNKKNDKPKADPNKVYDIADAGSITFGNPNAPVTLIKWTDFQ